MCPPACSDEEPERTVSNRGLTGNLISVVFAGNPRAKRVGLIRGLDAIHSAIRELLQCFNDLDDLAWYLVNPHRVDDAVRGDGNTARRL